MNTNQGETPCPSSRSQQRHPRSSPIEVQLEEPLLTTATALRLVFKKDYEFKRWLKAQKDSQKPLKVQLRQPSHDSAHHQFEKLHRVPAGFGNGDGSLLPVRVSVEQPLPPRDRLEGSARLLGSPLVLHSDALHDPYILYSILLSGLYIFTLRANRRPKPSQLPPCPDPRLRRDLSLVVGEIHNRRRPIPSENPSWLVIPERGLYTGIAIFGAIGTGKTSCCMYPLPIFEPRTRPIPSITRAIR